MENNLFPDEFHTDYSSGSFMRTYIIENAIYYAAFHHELYRDTDDLLDETGRIYVVMVHPTGQHHFYMKRGADNWIVDDDDGFSVASSIGQKMIEWLSEQIYSKK